jgi:uncharacterized membrane protein
MKNSSRGNLNMIIFIMGFIIFFGIHSISLFSRPLRDRLLARIGESKWKGYFTLLAILGLTLLVMGYVEVRKTPTFVYHLPDWFRSLVWILMLPVFPLLILAYLPGTFREMIPHPMVTSIILWSGSHLLVNGTLGDIILFGMFFIWSIGIYISMVKHPRDGGLKQPVSLQMKYDLIAMVTGLILYFSYFLWLHEMIIGMRVH